MTYMKEPECSDECTCEARSKWAMQEIKVMKDKISKATEVAKATLSAKQIVPYESDPFNEKQLYFATFRLGAILRILEGSE